MTRNAVRARLVVLALASIPLAACGSTHLPARLNRTERQLVLSARASRLPITVGVEEGHGAGDLVRFLSSTGVFARVEPLAALSSPPDLVARVDGRCSYHYGGWIPILPILTLGIIPQSARVGYGYAYSLASPGREERIAFGCREREGVIVVGWAGTLLNVLPSWTLGDPEVSPRFYYRLALDLVRKREDLLRLANAPAPPPP